MVSNERANGQGRQPADPQWVMLALGVLLVVLAWRGEWLALLGLPLLLLLKLSWPGLLPQADPARHGRGLPVLLEHLLPVWSRQLEAADRALQSGTQELLESFTPLVEHPQRPPEDPQLILDVWQHAEKALQGLQFADRLSQMLQVLKQDIDKLAASAPAMEAAGPADAERWLQELHQTYTTDEQRSKHAGQGPQLVRGQGVDYFD